MKWLAALVALGVANPAQAQWISGNDLQKWCSSSDTFYKGQCLAFTMGVLDASPAYDTPQGVTRGQLMAVVTQYLANNPADWNLPASILVKLAVAQAWPKPKSAPRK